MKPKLAIVATHPIQHFAPVYRRVTERGAIDTRVFYLSDAGARRYQDPGFGKEFAWDIDMLSGYDYRVLEPGMEIASSSPWHADSPGLGPHLRTYQPDAVLLYGYAQALQWRAWIWGQRLGAALLYFSDSSRASLSVPWPRRLAKEIIVRAFLRRIDRYLVPGDQNADYLAHYGADRNKMRSCPLSVDLRRFQIREPGGSDVGARCRGEFSVPGDRFAVLFSGKFVSWKRPSDIVHALARLRDSGRRVTGVFAGSGPELNRVQSEAARLGVSELCRFLGFVNQSAMVRVQYAVDALVVPSSRDAHPLAVTEAAACGLPIIASDAIGCIGATDTVRQGVNTIVYPCADITALARAIATLDDDRGLASRMGVASLRVAETQDVTVAAEALESTTLELCASR